MKKILLLLAIPLLLQSCLFEDDDKFDKSASERLQERIDLTKSTIKAASNGWILHYFPDLQYGGYNYWYSFGNEKATAAGAIGDNANFPPTYTEECLYDVIAEQGAILTFNTYGELVHYFRNPSASAYQGMLGDYEFMILDVADTEIRLKGKTTSNTMRMYPMPSGYTTESYLEAVLKNEKIGKYGSFIAKYKGTDLGITTGNSGGRFLSIESVESSGQIVKTTIPVVYTHEGLTVYHENVRTGSSKGSKYFPITEDSYYTEFVYDAGSSSFVSKDGNMTFAVREIPLNELLAFGMWDINPIVSNSTVCSNFASTWAISRLMLSLLYGTSLSYVSMGTDPTATFKSALTFWGSPYSAICGINIVPEEGTNDQMSVVFVGNGLNWDPLGGSLKSVLQFFEKNSPFKIEVLAADADGDPTSVKLIGVNDDTKWVIFNLNN